MVVDVGAEVIDWARLVALFYCSLFALLLLIVVLVGNDAEMSSFFLFCRFPQLFPRLFLHFITPQCDRTRHFFYLPFSHHAASLAALSSA